MSDTSAALPDHVRLSFADDATRRAFIAANESYVNLYAFLMQLRTSKDPVFLKSALAVLKNRFFAPDADEPVQLASQVSPLAALEKVSAAGGNHVPDVLVTKLLSLTVKKLEALVAAFKSGSVQLSVLLDGTLTQVAVSRDATVQQLQQAIGRKLGRDLSDCAMFRKSSDVSHRRGTLLVAEELLPAERTLRDVCVREDEILSCVASRKVPAGAAGGATSGMALQQQQQQLLQQRLRVLVPMSNSVAVELRVPDGMTCAALATTVLKGVDGVLVLFSPGQDTDAELQRLEPNRVVASYNIKRGAQYLFCCPASEWDDASSDYTASNSSRAWLALLTDWERVRVQQRGHVLKNKLRAGVPPWTRECIWALLLNAYAARAEQPGLYATLVVETPPTRDSGRWESDRQIVFRDISRTFPTHPFFAVGEGGKHAPGAVALQNVLLAWHSMEPATGYCQGINFVAAVFLLHMDEELAFWSLHSLLTQHGLDELYKTGLPLLQQALDVFQGLLERTLPQLAAFFALHGIPVSAFASPWFHTLFSWRFPLSLVVRIFDLFLREGFPVLFRVALAVLKERQAELLAMDPDMVFLYLQDPDKFLPGLSDDEWIARSLRIKKTREMSIGAAGGNASSARPASAPITVMAKRVGVMLRELTVRGVRSNTSDTVASSVRQPNAIKSPAQPLTTSSSAVPVQQQQQQQQLLLSRESAVAEFSGSMWEQPDEGVLLLDEGEVVAGTPEKLVEHLTSPKFPGQLFTDAFLLTFRTFLMPLRLTQLLRARLECLPRAPLKMSAADFSVEVAQPIRLRVFTCLRLWISAYPRDFDDAALVRELDVIVGLFRAAALDNMADRIVRSLAARPAPQRPVHPVSVNLKLDSQQRTQTLLDGTQAVVLAKLLCVLDRKAYGACQPHHLLDQGSSVQVILRWNSKVGNWIETALLRGATTESVLARFQYFVHVADACLEMNDVSGMVTIVQALRWVLHCFPRTFPLVKRCPLALQHKWAYLLSLVERDMASLADARFFFDRYRGGAVAVVPWISCFNDAARAIWAEMPDTMSLDSNRPAAVNFRKRLLLWQIVEGFLLFQRVDFDGTHAPPLFTATDAGARDTTAATLRECIWGSDEVARETLQDDATRLSTMSLKWTSSNKSPSISPMVSPIPSPRSDDEGGKSPLPRPPKSPSHALLAGRRRKHADQSGRLSDRASGDTNDD